MAKFVRNWPRGIKMSKCTLQKQKTFALKNVQRRKVQNKGKDRQRNRLAKFMDFGAET